MPTVRKSNPTDLYYALVQGAALLLFLVGASFHGEYRNLRSQGAGYFLLTSEMRVPQGDAWRMTRAGLAPHQLREVQQVLAPVAPVTTLVAEEAVAYSQGRGMPVRTITVDSLRWLDATGGANASCDGSVAFVSGSGLRAGDALTLGERILRAQPVSLAWMAGILGDVPDGPLLVVCDAGAVASRAAQALLVEDVPGGGVRHALAAAQALPVFDGEKLFSARLKVEAANDAVLARLRTVYGWVPAFVLLALLVPVLVACGWGMLAASLEARNIGIKRVLGAGQRRIVRGFSVRVLVFSAVAGLVALGGFAVLVWLGVFPLSEGVAFAALAVRLGGLLGAAIVAAVAAHALSNAAVFRAPIALASLSSFHSGNRSFLLAWAIGFALSCALGAAVLLVHRHVAALDGISPGFDVSGVWAIPLRIAQAQGSDGTGPALAQRLLAQAGETVGEGAAVACFAPWRFSAVGSFANDDGMTGVGVLVSAGFFRVLGLPIDPGPGFGFGPSANPKAAVLQITSAQDASMYSRIYNVAGEVSGVRVGTYQPEVRAITFQPLSASPCQDFDLLFKGTGEVAREIHARVSAAHPEVAFGAPFRLEDVYRKARGRVSLLRDLLGLAVVAVLGLQAMLTAALAASVARSQGKDCAIRVALGATSRRAVWDVLRRTWPRFALAVLAAFVLSAWADGVLAAAIVGWQHRPGLVGMVILSAAVASLLLAAFPLWKMAASSAVWRKMSVD